MKEEILDGGPKGEGKEELGEGEWVSLNTLSLTQYLESQEDQDMTRLLNFTRTQEKRREGDFFVCLGMKERGVYIVVVEEIWMEGHLMRVDKESWT